LKTIKRYPNRKLYDTERSRYITLVDIANYLRKGGEVRVVDSKSGQDITSVTLAQVLLGEEKKSRADVSLQRLRDMIQTGGEYIQKKLGTNVTNLRDEAERTVQRLMKGEPAEELHEFVENTQKAYDDLQQKMDERLRVMVAAVRNLSPMLKDMAKLKGEIESLKRRVKALEATVSHDKGRSSTGKRKRAVK